MIYERFMHRVMPEPNSGCWFWMGKLNGDEYGQIVEQNRVISAHRRSWEFHKGKIPEGMKVLHRCDVACCVNPDHLFLGTQLDNVRDMMRKGRHRTGDVSGENNGMALLTTEEVRAIRQTVGRTLQVAANFGVSYKTVWQIRTGRRWGNVL